MSTKEPKAAETAANNTESDPRTNKVRATDDVAVRFGDIIKLYTRSAFAETPNGSVAKDSSHDKPPHELEGQPLVFQLHSADKDKIQQQILVVQPVSVDKQTMEAEFIIGSTKDEKEGEYGTVLHYKQPFVLKTSDGFSLNNKIPKFDDMVSLMKVNVKGEMFLTIEKDDYTAETPVQDGDSGFVLNVVDSNRIRKKYNKKLTHFDKKDSGNGGYVCCGAKGTQLQFSLLRDPDPDRKETKRFISDEISRRGSARKSVKSEEPKQEEAPKAEAQEEQEEQEEEQEQDAKVEDKPVDASQETTKEISKPDGKQEDAKSKDAAAPADKAAHPLPASEPAKKDEKKEEPKADKAAAAANAAANAAKKEEPAGSAAAAAPPPAPTVAAAKKDDKADKDKDKVTSANAKPPTSTEKPAEGAAASKEPKQESEAPNSKDDPKPSSTQVGASEAEVQDEQAANSCIGSWSCVLS